MVVFVLVSDGNDGALLWSSLMWRLVPESIDNEREERVHVNVHVGALMTAVYMCVCVCM